ncbi:MAG: alpha/beta hydrolase, partial [Blastocatellia bacterium]
MQMPRTRLLVLFTTALCLLPGAALAQDKATPAPATLDGATTHIYKTVGNVKLPLHMFTPTGHKATDKRAAIVFFFGGGWTNGTPAQFQEHGKYLASRGMIAISVEYRVKSRHNVTPVECVTDARSAMRWVRGHAREHGIDPNRIAAGGGSAGGHLAATLATVNGFDESGEDTKISVRPAALVLFNPALDLVAFGRDFGLGDKTAAISPLQQLRGKQPPTIIFHGTADTTVPIKQARDYCAAMKKEGNTCEVKEYEGRNHGFFNHGRGNGQDYKSTVQAMDAFLVALGYL